MAFGKPVLGMLDGEGAAIIEEANAGLTCKAGDYIKLAGNIKLLYSLDKSELSAMGDNGRQYCAQNFNRELLFRKFEEIYSDFSRK
jgi:glycosyltransferase involved in cell wall biosynthesis